MDTEFSYFYEVARLGSIRQAAEKLHVSASSISRQIRKLEYAFDVELVQRHPQGVKLTPAGEVVARFVQGRSRELQRLKSFIDALKGLQRGHVSVYTVEGMIDGLLPRALTDFAERYPGITYEVRVAGTDNVMQAVAEDRCDIGISFHPVPRHDVEAVATVAQPLHAVMTPSHPLAFQEQLSLEELTLTPIGLPDSSFGIRHLIDNLVKAHNLQANIRLETNSIDMMRRFALHGLGIVFLPIFAFERELANGTLIAVPLADNSLATAKMQVCKRAEIEPTLAAQEFINILVRHSQSQPSVAKPATGRAQVNAS